MNIEECLIVKIYMTFYDFMSKSMNLFSRTIYIFVRSEEICLCHVLDVSDNCVYPLLIFIGHSIVALNIDSWFDLIR